MKNTMKRGLSLLLVLTLFLGLLSGLTFHVDAAYASAEDVVYNTSGGKIYNWGTREEEASFLTTKADAFYKKNNTSYEKLSALSGSTSTSSVPNSALYKELKSLMASNQRSQTSYEATKNLFQYTDCQGGGGKISSFYSGTAIGPAWGTSPKWNREHIWPNSKGDASGNGENDIMMLRPTAQSENSSRGNKAFGNVTSANYYNPNDEGNKKYDLRGDVARIILYTYVRWECTNTGSDYNPTGIFGTKGVIESKQVMLDWIEADPVDTWELGRNDSVESITGTRNVFVDYPELAFIMFGESVPSDMQTPSGEASKNAYTVTATTNNSAYGTVSLNGKVITATPKAGYEVTGYTVTSGSATVTRSGNTFTVRPTSNCTVRINFAERAKYTVRFSENGTVQTTQTPYAGDAFKLPAAVVGVDSSYTFVGWLKTTLTDTQTKPGTIYYAGNNYTATSSHTMYGLYSYQYMGATYYSTNATPCEHTDDVIEIPATEATCTESGNTAGYFCNDCGHYYGGYSVIASLGHSYTSVVTAPTVTTQGYTTHTCSTCGDSYVDSYVEALGETYTVNFCVPDGVTDVADMACGKNGIILPTAGVPVGETTYSFVGWTTAPVIDTTNAPVILAGGSQYTAKENVDLYAVYTYLVGGSVVAGTYEKITAAPSSWEGEYVITGTVTDSNTTYAFLADGTTPNTAAAAKMLNTTGMTLNGDKLAGVTDQYVVVVEKVGTHYSLRLKGASSTLYMMTANSNSGLNTATTTKENSAQWDISWTNGEVVIRNVAYGSRTLRFNASSKQFRTYTSGQNAVVLYSSAGASGTAYYTTLGSTAQCPHGDLSYVDNKDNTHDQVCACGEVVIDNEKHSYDENHACVCGHTVLNVTTAATLKAMLQLDFTIDVTKLEGNDNYAVLTRTYADGTAPEVVTIAQKDWAKSSNTTYTVSYTKIAPKEMGDDVTVVFYNAAGEQVSVAKTDSIERYAYRGLKALAGVAAGTRNATLRTLLVDMLNYGAAAQEQFKYDTENLVTADLTDAQKAWATQADVEVTNAQEKDAAKVFNTTLTLKSAIQMDIIVYTSAIGADYTTNGVYAIATYNDHYGDPHEIRVEGKDFAKYSNTQVQISVVGMAVADYESLVTVTIYDAAGNEITTAKDSMESYAYRALAATQVGTTINTLCKNLMKFSAVADQYFATK